MLISVSLYPCIPVSLYPGTFGEWHLVDSSGRRIHNAEFNLLRKHMSMDTTSIQISMNGIVVATMTIFLSNGYHGRGTVKNELLHT